MADLSEKITEITEIVTPFDEFEYEALLDEIQGNILKSHGRNHAVHLFLTFKGDIEAAKQWIGNFTHKYVTSALAQAEEAKQYRQNKDVPGKIFANFFLTRAGYMHLGYKYEELPVENPFRQGMKDANIQNELGDDVQQWDPGFKDHEIHALVLLAADKIVGPRTQEAKLKEQKNQELLRKQPALLAQKVEAIKQELTAIAEVVHEDIGYVLRSPDTGAEIEHFGFRDGVSQPLFLKGDIDKEKEHSKFSKWDPCAPLNLVLFKDPLGQKQESYGSFLVYRKLEQNVKAQNEDVVHKLAEKLKGSGAPNPDLAGAYTMGRFKDGTPVVLEKTPSPKEPEENNFNYKEDQQGLKCPFHAHTRKVNPRGDTPVPLKEEKMHRIVRRGINYGTLPSEEPEKDAGLLFMCFQASLSNQFNFMQKAWAKERNFVQRDVGTDTLIGVEKKDDQGQVVTETYQWPTNWGEPGQTEADFSHWVTMKGGEYFFAPSMSFLKSLAPAPSLNIVFRGVPKQEIQAAKDTIAELRDYQQRNWGIGLNGETSEPDGFLRFFDQRKLPFKFYVRSPQLALGEPSAYDENIATLNKYIEDVRNQEIDASEYKIAELKEYQELYWAIGLNGTTLEPDGFVSFFGEREQLFKFFVRSEVAVGDESAYDENIRTLNNYISSLKEA
jgi:Dyp-type peroxidase family